VLVGLLGGIVFAFVKAMEGKPSMPVKVQPIDDDVEPEENQLLTNFERSNSKV
jgi:hypothetical protein